MSDKQKVYLFFEEIMFIEVIGARMDLYELSGDMIGNEIIDKWVKIYCDIAKINLSSNKLLYIENVLEELGKNTVIDNYLYFNWDFENTNISISDDTINGFFIREWKKYYIFPYEHYLDPHLREEMNLEESKKYEFINATEFTYEQVEKLLLELKIDFSNIVNQIIIKYLKFIKTTIKDLGVHSNIFCNNGFELFEYLLENFVKPKNQTGHNADVLFCYHKLFNSEPKYIHQRIQSFLEWYHKNYDLVIQNKTYDEVKNPNREKLYSKTLELFKLQK